MTLSAQHRSTVLGLTYAAITAAVISTVDSSLFYWLRTDDLFNSGQYSAFRVAAAGRHATLLLVGLVAVVLAWRVLRAPSWFPGAVAAFMLIGAAPFRLAFLIDVESYWPSTILVLVLASLWRYASLNRAGESMFAEGELGELMNLVVGTLIFVMSVSLVNDIFADFEPRADAIPLLRLALYCLMPAVVGFVVCFVMQRTIFAARGLWLTIAALGLASAVFSMVPEFRWEPDSFWWRAWAVETLGGIVLVASAAIGERLGIRTSGRSPSI